MRRLIPLVICAVNLFHMLGCGSNRTTTLEATCTYARKVYQLDETFQSIDGCNSCVCEEQGVSCTTKSCANTNITNNKTNNDDEPCTYDGKVYKTGDTFAAIDGCNTCSCNPEGSKGVGCTLLPCDKECPTGPGFLNSAPFIPSPSCPCAPPTSGDPCPEDGASCAYTDTFCEWQIEGYKYESSIWECNDGSWTPTSSDCPNCCHPHILPSCGDKYCDPNDEYCLKLECDTPGCTPPLPRCEPLPTDCYSCGCLEPTLKGAAICGGPANCIDSRPVTIECPAT